MHKWPNGQFFSSIEMQFVETFAGYYAKNELLL